MSNSTLEDTSVADAKAAAAQAKAIAKQEKEAAAAKVKAEKQAEREAAAVAKANAPKRHCLCGCGGEVKGKSSFLPGHDARTVGLVARGELEASVLAPFPFLTAKADKMRAALEARKAEAAERAEAKAKADATKAVTDAEKEAKRVADQEAKAKAKQTAAEAKAQAKEAAAATKAANAAQANPAKTPLDNEAIEVKIGRNWVAAAQIAADGKGTIVAKFRNESGKFEERAFKAKDVRTAADL